MLHGISCFVAPKAYLCPVTAGLWTFAIVTLRRQKRPMRNFGYILRRGLCFIDVFVDALRCKSTTLRGYKLRQAVHARRDAVL